MKITYDPTKNETNIRERNLPFDLVADINWESAIIEEYMRRPYGETRLRVLAFLHGRIHAAVITPRGDSLRVISLRRAHKKEREYYVKEATKKTGKPLPN